MAKYSKKILDIMDIVINYYKKNDDFKILQNFIYFMIDSIHLVDEEYFVLSKGRIEYYLGEAKKVWGKNGSPKKLKKLFDEYEKELTRIKSKNEIRSNYHSAWCLIMTVLHNFRKEPFKYHILTAVPKDIETEISSACRTISMFIETLPRINIEDEKIIPLLEKYFIEILK